MQLTVAVPALNEERDLPRTLNSLSFAAEVLVIDSGSTDSTIKIAKDFGATVISHPLVDYASQRNFADQVAKYDWVLSLEADVVVPEALASEIKVLKDDPAVYRLGRINVIWQKPILHTDWGPKDDNHIRFYHRTLGRWESIVHEQFVTTSNPKQLKNHLVHYNYETVSEFISKINSYSDFEAQKRKQKGQKFSYSRLFFEPVKDFLKRYFYKLGFLDGFHGFFLSLLQAIYYVVVNIKLRYLCLAP